MWQKGDNVDISNALSTWDVDFEFVGLSVHDNNTSICSVLNDLVERLVPCRVGNAIPWARYPPGWLCQSPSSAWLHYKTLRDLFGRRNARALETLVKGDSFKILQL